MLSMNDRVDDVHHDANQCSVRRGMDGMPEEILVCNKHCTQMQVRKEDENAQ